MSQVLQFSVLAVVFWGTLILYGTSSLWWLFQVGLLSRGWQAADPTAVPLENVQVRILTVAAEETVQVTANTVPDAIAETHVIAERDIDIDGAAVHVVPESFTCAAQRKGRALEWAREQVPCEQEYVLYLDEDSILTEFQGLPAADIVQISEHPLRTGSWFTYLCEIFRIGYQFEQRAFHRFAYPPYAWGGAIAVRKELEDRVTWDVPTITEDTTFIWRAADLGNLEYRLVNARIRNQAPPTLRSMVKQRRRWISGTINDIDLLPLRYRPIIYTRIVTWTLSPIVPFVGVIGFLFPNAVPASEYYVPLSVLLFGMLYVFMAVGLVEYRKYPEVWPIYLLATPVVVLLHSLGAFWGILRPAKDFEVTAKTATISNRTIEELNPELEDGDLEEHTGTQSLGED
jgi:hypothetical protein